MLKYKVRVEGLRGILRTLNSLPEDGQKIVRDRSMIMARILARQIQAAGQADTRQSALAARTVQAKRDRFPVITAGSRGGRKARGVLYGSEFGMTRKSGWFRKARYFDSRGRQFRPHLGRGSYWFFRETEEREPELVEGYITMVNAIARKWGDGGR